MRRAADLYAADRVFNATTRAVAAFHLDHDVLLTPTMCSPNTALGHLDANDPGLDARGWYDRIFSFAGFTAPWWAPVLALGLVTAALAYVAGIEATRRLGPRLASFVALSEVLAALAFAWLLLDQRPGGLQVVGGGLVLAGVLVVLGEQEHRRRSDRTPADLG